MGQPRSKLSVYSLPPIVKGPAAVKLGYNKFYTAVLFVCCTQVFVIGRYNCPKVVAGMTIYVRNHAKVASH